VLGLSACTKEAIQCMRERAVDDGHIIHMNRLVLRAVLLGDRIPVRAKFSALVQTGPVAHPASYTRGTGSLSRG
jgi:hypothetical protein